MVGHDAARHRLGRQSRDLFISSTRHTRANGRPAARNRRDSLLRPFADRRDA